MALQGHVQRLDDTVHARLSKFTGASLSFATQTCAKADSASPLTIQDMPLCSPRSVTGPN